MKIPYTELKSTATSIIAIVSEKTGYADDDISINTSLNNHLGINGDDWNELLQELVQKVNIDMTGFEADKYFFSDRELSDASLFNLLAFPFFAIAYLLSGVRKTTTFRNYVNNYRGKKKAITIGDLIATKFAGKFIHRSEVIFGHY